MQNVKRNAYLLGKATVPSENLMADVAPIDVQTRHIDRSSESGGCSLEYS